MLLGGNYGPEQIPDPIVFDPRFCPQESGALAYRILVQRIESSADLNSGSSTPRDVVVLVDGIRPRALSAISDRGDWDHLVAMLVLTFPEISWVFGAVLGEVDGFPIDDHSLSSLFARPRREPLLDSTGLREWVKHKTNDAILLLTKPGDPPVLGVPARKNRAASIDEETDYAFMHGYAAFRYGFMVEVVTSWSLMENLFGKEAAEKEEAGYSLIIEDMRLKFHDKPEAVHLSRLKTWRLSDGKTTGRSHHCPLLNDDLDASRWRFLITTGQLGADQDLMRDNEEYLDRKIIGRGAILYKPLGGISDLWEKSGLTEDLADGARPGNASGFVWPPLFQDEGSADGHGSPGKLALVATTLLQRAGALRETANTVMEFIRGAVLAVESTELLGGKTPTLTLVGLSLKHEFEVKAECAFVGVGYHFGLRRRLEELGAEVAAITRWFHEGIRKKAAGDAKASILNRLILAFREAGKMEEEEECLVVLRRLNRKMSAPASLNPLRWLTHATLSYGEWLLASFSRIVLLTIFWFVALIGAAWLSANCTWVVVASEVGTWFFGGSMSSRSVPWMVLSWLGAVVGVFHLGVLISYLYSLIARK